MLLTHKMSWSLLKQLDYHNTLLFFPDSLVTIEDDQYVYTFDWEYLEGINFVGQFLVSFRKKT